MASPMTSSRARAAAGGPTLPTGREIASYDTYAAAQAAVDHLSDEHFPVQHVTIVGTDLQMVERVLGRLTYARTALAGLFSGAWVGLLIGLVLLLLSPPEAGVLAILPAVLIGAAFGVIFSIAGYAATRGRRDFTSVSQIVASRYAVLCAVEQAGQAREVLGRSPEASRGLDRRLAATGGTAAAPTGTTPAPGAPAAPAAPAAPPTGPTYSEMLARRREEEARREDAAGHEDGTPPPAAPGTDRPA